MRPGGGKDKGSSFERVTGTQLSLWVSEGHRADLFARNVLSGGQFTNSVKKGSLETGTPGDLMANHPRAFDFLSTFFIECKHYADLNFEQFLFDEAKSFLGKVMAGCRKQADQADPPVFPLIIAKQNRRATVMLMDGEVGKAFLGSIPPRLPCPRHHFLHSSSVLMIPLAPALAVVRAAPFIAATKLLRNALK